MTPGQAIDALRRLGCNPEVDGADLRLVAPSGALGAALLDWLREHKAALLDKLTELPAFTDADEAVLMAFYCEQPRAVRLTLHRRGEAIAKRNDWPAREADLSAMREHRTTFTAGTAPADSETTHTNTKAQERGTA